MRTSRILCVEDDADTRELLVRCLESGGYRVVAVADAEAAAERLDEERFDLMLIDYMLPGADGGWLIAWARATGYLASMAAIVLTSHDRPIGVSEYPVVRKPIEAEALRRIIADALAKVP